MDEAHCLNAVRYRAFNPVRAGLCDRPEDWRWSSVKAHLAETDDPLTRGRPVLDMSRDERAALDGFEPPAANGRPLASAEFLAEAARGLDCSLRREKPGPKRRD